MVLAPARPTTTNSASVGIGTPSSVIDTAASTYIENSTHLMLKRSASQPPPTAPITAPKFKVSTKVNAEPRL